MTESGGTSSTSPGERRAQPPLITLDEISLVSEVSADDEVFREEARDYDTARKALDLERLRSDLDHRKRYSARLFWLVTGWLAFILLLVVVDGLALLEISDTVLVALIGSTTLNVIGLFAIVARYFFPKK